MNAKALRPAVFFDRDGTLMEEVHYCNDPAKVRAISGAADALRRLAGAGWLRVVVTNQSGIASGKISLAQYRAVEAELDRQLDNQLDATYFCPDSPSAPTGRRKPGTGMLEEAACDLHIDLGASWMIGDRDIDIACGRAAGCRTVLVQTGYGRQQTGSQHDRLASDVAEAIEIILADGA